MSDPFTDHALRPTTSNATSLPSSQLRNQASQSSLRSGAGSAASNRARSTRETFTSALSRRPPGRAQNRATDDVHVDSDSDHEIKRAPVNARLKRMGRMSPESRQLKHKSKAEEEADIVYRQPDGSFLREVPGEAEALMEHLESQELKEEEQYEAVDDEYASIARDYFVSGGSVATVRGRKLGYDFDEVQPTALAHLRNQVLQKLEDERWRFEATAS